MGSEPFSHVMGVLNMAKGGTGEKLSGFHGTPGGEKAEGGTKIFAAVKIRQGLKGCFAVEAKTAGYRDMSAEAGFQGV